jgi:polyvinyl alcohol dehydrogenase (cytochrome)
MVITGIGANSIEGVPTFHGSIVFLDQDTGAILHRTWTIPPELWDRGFSGGGVWGTVAIDTDRGYAYTGTGNPFNSAREYGTTNALIKIDVDRTRATFGDIVATYKGTPEQYVTSERTACRLNDALPPTALERLARLAACEFLDLDFGASPNLFESDGRRLVGANQKGIYHAADADTMAPSWTATIGPPLAPTNAVSAAFADGALYVSENPPNWVVAMDALDGTRRWAALHAGANDLRHYEPTSIANGVVYQLDGNGIVHAYDAAGGTLLLARPMSQDVGAPAVSTQSGGVAIARNTVYAAADQYVVALRP